MVTPRAGTHVPKDRSDPGLASINSNSAVSAPLPNTALPIDTWNQTIGDWTESADWSDGEPTFTSAAQIEGGVVTIASADGAVEANSVSIFTIPQVSLSTPELITNGTLITGALLVTDGTIDGAGIIDTTAFMQGDASAGEDQPTYATTMGGSLSVETSSLTVGGGKRRRFHHRG